MLTTPTMTQRSTHVLVFSCGSGGGREGTLGNGGRTPSDGFVDGGIEAAVISFKTILGALGVAAGLPGNVAANGSDPLGIVANASGLSDSTSSGFARACVAQASRPDGSATPLVTG